MKSMKRIGMSLAALLGCCAMASAAVGVGDKPEFGGKAVGGGQMVRSGDLKGRIVVVDFWATWCPPCVKSIPHLVELNKELGPKGLVTVGISLDQGPGVIPPFAKKNNMTWPTIMDKQNGAEHSAVWGVNSIPRVFILDPEGTVTWTGNPLSNEFEKALRDTFEKTPPTATDEKKKK